MGEFRSAWIDSWGRNPPRAALGIIGSLAAAVAAQVWLGAMYPAPPPEVLYVLGAQSTPALRHGEWFRLPIGAFLHLGFPHLMANVGLLVAPTMLLEGRLGAARTLVVLGVSALVGGVLATVGRPDSISLGSSAMGCGVLGALASVAWRSHRDLPRGLVILIAGVLTGVLAAEQLFALVDSSFGVWGHVGGFACGAVLGLAMEEDRRRRPGGGSRPARLLAAVLVAVFAAAPLAAWRNVASGRACGVAAWGPWDEETHTEMLRILRSYGAPCEIGDEALNP